MSLSTVNVAEYIYTRLHQLGVRHLYGLPGDFNLLACDFVRPCGLTWVGNCNELNAGYAADAYARIAGLGAVLTTFGVGELACASAIAGSFSEHVPVVHIVGVPSRKAQRDKEILHHTLGDGDFDVFFRMAKEITISQANLIDPLQASTNIDRVLCDCLVYSRPVYIRLPIDMVEEQIDALPLRKPLNTKPPTSDEEAECAASDLILARLYAAKDPVLLVDAGVRHHHVEQLADDFARTTGLPIFIAPMGKGAIDEELPNFVGIYNGRLTRIDAWRERVESSDLVITLGHVASDLNTGGFSSNLSRQICVHLQFNTVKIGFATIERVYMRWLLVRLLQDYNPSTMKSENKHAPMTAVAQVSCSTGEDITHDYLWPRLSLWLQPGDTVVAETGTSCLGVLDTKLRPGVRIISQILWSSIGYGVPACQGAAQAMEVYSKGNRTICFEGDGSFQLTTQEVSTIINHNLDVIMFVLENDGYEIERWIHGKDANYNDVSKWRYSQLPEAFTPTEKAPRTPVRSYKVSTRTELETLLASKEFSHGEGLRFVEMHMPKHNAPVSLEKFAQKLKS